MILCQGRFVIVEACIFAKDTFGRVVRFLGLRLTELKRILLLAGSPGVGKTTVLVNVVEGLKSKGYSVGGMLSREVRSGGNRVGFEILSLTGNQRGWLAQVDQNQGPQVGKYRVNLFDLDRVGVVAVAEAVDSCQVVAIDEVGPMELFSDSFKKAVAKAIQSEKLVVATVHWRQREFLISTLKDIQDVEWFEVTMNNREKLHELILKEAIDFLRWHS
jgi:nucleoside-triphosphatase